ncbi:hypothetical protein RRG08_017850 [Elysia crispata]|uniref:Uncharacterized protein n=1 Tax=Elysia crispata TaxID=231223 RepID=A0AAE0XPK1_9GAST|nr:hypothetical protein RRG08_017850 [Elysia crispata]
MAEANFRLPNPLNLTEGNLSKQYKMATKKPFDTFLTELRSRADLCNFQEKERMIRDKLVFKAKKHLQEKLLRDNELTLEKAIGICGAYEQTTNCMKEMNK